MRTTAPLLSAVLALLVLPAGDAAACDFANYIPHVVSADPDDTVAPGKPRIESIAVRRGEHEADGFSCEPLGTITLRVVATDDRSAGSDIGYQVRFAGGELPAGLTIPDEPIAPQDNGDMFLSWVDAEFEYPLEFSITIAAVDAAGNVGPASPPIALADPGSSGCQAGGPASTGGALAIGILAVAFARRRRRHSARV